MVGVTLWDSGSNEVCIANGFNLVDLKVDKTVVKFVVQLIQKFHNLPFGVRRECFNIQAINLCFPSKCFNFI